MSTSVLGERIKALRKQAELTQLELAEKLCTQREKVNYYESGARVPKIEDIALLADIFSVSVDYLLGRTDIQRADATLQDINDKTGLSEKALEILVAQKGRAGSTLAGVVNMLIENCTSEFSSRAEMAPALTLIAEYFSIDTKLAGETVVYSDGTTLDTGALMQDGVYLSDNDLTSGGSRAPIRLTNSKVDSIYLVEIQSALQMTRNLIKEGGAK